MTRIPTKKTRTASRRPRFKKDYDLGWIGFVHAPNTLSRTIAYLTRRQKAGPITVSHSFIVTGKDECVEANFPVGVITTQLSKDYFGRKDRLVVLRRPRGLTEKAAQRIVKRAKAQVGAKFDYGVFAAGAFKGSFVGHLINSVFQDRPQELIDKLLNRKNRWICSELVAYCLRKEPRYRGKGALSCPPGTVDPQQLFEDEKLFEPLSQAEQT